MKLVGDHQAKESRMRHCDDFSVLALRGKQGGKDAKRPALGEAIAPRRIRGRRSGLGFTLIELLVVISIISLLISILLPSLGRAREQAKGVHCLARLKEFGNAIATYENVSGGVLPPARWLPAASDLAIPTASDSRRIEYGWAELLFHHVYQDEVRVAESYPVLRNVEGERWQRYLLCRAADDEGPSSGHYRVYLPSWGGGAVVMDSSGRWGPKVRANPDRGINRDRLRPKMPLLGDSNELSERGDGLGDDDCSYVDAGEANYAGFEGRGTGNRFSDRHYGGTNFLFQDLHAEWSTRLRSDLARDYDLNGVVDIDGGG